MLLSPLSGALAQTLYWTGVRDYPEFVLRRGGPDGSDVDDFGEDIDGDLGGLAIDVQAGTMYWVENGLTEHRIVRGNLEGGDRKILLRTEDFLLRIAVDTPRNAIYFTAAAPEFSSGIHIMGLEGEDPHLIVEVESSDFAVDGERGKLYWAQEGDRTPWAADIWRADLDGKNAEPIAHHDFDHYTTGIVLDTANGKIYWSTVDYREGREQIVQRANLDGTNVEDITRANPGLDDWPVHLDIDHENGLLYWVNGEDGVFYRVSLDGGEAERLFEEPGPFGPFDLVILPSKVKPPPAQFRRGDADGSGSLDLTDAVFTLGVLFLGTGTHGCDDAADANDDGKVDIADVVASLGHQFLGDFTIPPPGPRDCGPDPSPADELDCERHPTCTP